MVFVQKEKMKNRAFEIPSEDNFIIQWSDWAVLEDMIYRRKQDEALEFMLALGRYNFFGEEYEGSSDAIRWQLMQRSVQIDTTKIKYQQAKNGGKGNCKVSDEELWEAWTSGEFRSKAELGRHFGITGQAVGQRLKKIQNDTILRR